MNYTYDAAGNRTQAGAQAFTYDERNQQLTGADGTNTWTARGTLATSTKNAVTTNYAYDGIGRMITAGAASFTYDGLDRVHQRTEAATTNTFIYAGRESDPIGDGTNIYSRQGGRLLGVKNGATNLAAGGDITHLFNPATANVSDTKIFDPFGVPAGATGTTPNRIGYQSDWTDPTTSQVWMGARWYSPASDTFTSRDVTPGRLRNPVSLNRYTYAANNPNVDGNLVHYPDIDRCARALRPFNIMTAVSTQGWQLFPCV